MKKLLIGIRKAIGATLFGVFIQELAEMSVVLAALGGRAGLLASQGLAVVLETCSAPAMLTPR